ncbi:MAG TPA: hypothetical protein VLT32_04600 [Candidatus Sulfomarinibacteraceae bacterium]|nr:hypothetical protein [Candidatus Sulfomarinibacteraceae bacterium]
MNSERLEALLWERIDGTINDAERDELETALAADPGARRLEAEIAHMAGRLEALPRLTPGRDLRSRIASALSEARAPGPPAAIHASSIPRRRSIHRPAAWLPLAACLVIGVAFGLILASIGGVAVETSKATGAMGADTARPGTPLRFELDSGLGLLTVTRTGPEAIIELRLETDDEITLAVGQPGAEITISELGDAAGPDRSLTVVEGRMVMRSRGPGAIRLGITAGSDTAPLHLEVSADGATVAERWVE